MEPPSVPYASTPALPPTSSWALPPAATGRARLLAADWVPGNRPCGRARGLLGGPGDRSIASKALNIVFTIK